MEKIQEKKKKLKSELIWFGLLGFIVIIIFTSFALRGSEYFSIQNIKNTSVFFPLITISSLLDSVNPCAFSVLLLTIAFLLNVGRTRMHILKVGGLYILGIFLVYILIGLGILSVLDIFNIPRLMSKAGATILILFGALSIIGAIFPRFPIKLGIPKSAHGKLATFIERASYPAGLILGILVGLFEFPCTGGPYLFVLGLLHDQGSFWSGFLYLLWYNLIFVSPLIVMLFLAANEFALEKLKEWRKKSSHIMKIWGALAMILLGIFIFLF
jgi:cytochrome c biogenesis protein CcdA